MSDRPVYVLTLVPLPGHAAPPAVRLRRLLKAAGRCYGLRCVRAEELPGAGEAGCHQTDTGGYDEKKGQTGGGTPLHATAPKTFSPTPPAMTA